MANESTGGNSSRWARAIEGPTSSSSYSIGAHADELDKEDEERDDGAGPTIMKFGYGVGGLAYPGMLYFLYESDQFNSAPVFMMTAIYAFTYLTTFMDKANGRGYRAFLAWYLAPVNWYFNEAFDKSVKRRKRRRDAQREQ